MVSKKDITVIIPVHKWDESIEKMLKEALNSIPEGVSTTVVTTTEEIGVDISKKYKKVTGLVFVGTDDTCFQHMVNEGVQSIDTEWFSILEFDDEYSPIWFDNFIRYQEYNQQYNIFLPLNDLYNVEGGKDEFIGNGNEVAWASSFSSEIGVIDEQSLDDYFNFYLTGGIFRTETFRTLGMLKESIRLTFWYEFMLRTVHAGEKIYVVPKVGYAHVLGRAGSLMEEYRNTINVRESDFWFKTAKKESYYKEDRKKTYNPSEKDSEDGSEDEG